MQKKEVKINKSEISYELFESKTKNADNIVILHGWRGASSSWTKVGDLLNMAGYNVIIPDIPGASKLTKCNDIYTIELYAEIIEKFIEDLKTKHKNINFSNLILWGHSNGGAIAIKIVNRNKIKILRLVLNNSAGIRNDKKRSFKRKILNCISKNIKNNPLSGILSPYLKKRLKKIREYFYKFIGGQDYLEAEKKPNLKQTFLNMISTDLKEDIKKIDIFTLLLWGEKDTYTPISDAYFMRDNIKKSKLVVLENETHGIHLKNPKKLVETFLQNV